MKPKEYVNKYDLGTNDKFNYNEFMSDFNLDFLTLIETARKQSNWIYSTYKRLIDDMRKKFNAIDNKTNGKLPEWLWKKFYATTVQEQKELYFGDYLRAKQERWEKDRARREEERRYWDGSAMWEEFIKETYERAFEQFDKVVRKVQMTVSEAFSTINLPQGTPKDIVIQQCKSLLVKFHPDRNKEPDAEKKFKEVNNARETLKKHFGE